MGDRGLVWALGPLAPRAFAALPTGSPARRPSARRRRPDGPPPGSGTLRNRRDFWNENILVHEFAHTVKLLGFNACQLALVNRLHAAARASGAYDNGIYMLADANEVRQARQRAGV